MNVHLMANRAEQSRAKRSGDDDFERRGNMIEMCRVIDMLE